jgi:hypothetical protein
MRRIITALFALALTIGAVPTIGAAKTECNGTITSPVNGGLTVGPGDHCDVEGTTVNGGIQMTGGTLRVCGSTVSGDVKVTGASSAGVLCFFDCDCVTLGDENDAHCAGNVLNGNVSIVNVDDTKCELEVGNSTVNGGVDFDNNTAHEIGVEGDTINGSLDCEGNSVSSIDNDREPNTVTGQEKGQCSGL